MHWSVRLDRFVAELYMNEGRFHALSQVDKQIVDGDTRIARELIEVCDQLSRLIKGTQ